MPQQREYKHTVVQEEEDGQRLDVLLASRLQDLHVSRSKIGRWIKMGQARINNQVCLRPGVRVSAGDELQLELAVQEDHPLPIKGDLQVIWQDSQLLVLNKPAGLTVHPAASCHEETLVHHLLHSFPELRDLDPERPGIVHRLDKDTSGLLLVARTKDSQRELARDLAGRRVCKEYLALVHGCPEQAQGQIEQPLGRDPGTKVKMKVLPDSGRKAKTWYRVLQIFEHKQCSLLQVGIETGRTHQIRVHLAYIGHPVLGDQLYARSAFRSLLQRYPVLEKLCPRQMLHAWRLQVRHPGNKAQLKFTQSVPGDFYRTLLFLEQKTQRLGITGAVGCGKSSLTSLLAASNIPVWNADKVVAELYRPYADGWEILRRNFGSRFFVSAQGEVDKVKLFQAMQQSRALQEEIQALIHPLVQHSLQEFWARHQGAILAVAEVPLLLEAGWQKHFDVVLGVYCPDALRRTWLSAKRGWDAEQAAKMESWQLSQEQKIQGVDLILENPGHWSGLESRTRSLLRVLRYLRRRRLQRFVYHLQQIEVIQLPARG